MSQALSESQSTSISTSLDPAEEERLRSRCWLETVGGRYKGRVYGIGRVDRQDDCVGRYIQETQSSSSNNKANSEEIVELKQHIERMDAKFQNLQNFQNFMMQYLPLEVAATAQQFFQQPNTPLPTQPNQQSNEVQHHSNHDEQKNSPGEDYNNY